MLKYNGSILKLNSGSIIDEVRYNVNLVQSTGGTISASPNSGTNGTTVTLSNTPNTGYEFSSYSLTGSTLKNSNQFDINGSNVNVVGNFNTLCHEYANFGTQSWTHGGPSYTLPAEADIPYNYIMFKLYMKLPNISACHFGSHLYLRTINSGGTCIMGIRYNVTAFTAASGVSGISYDTRDGCRSYKWSGWSNGSEALYRIIYDIANRTPHVYVGNTYLGYGTMNSSMLDTSMSFTCYYETSTPTIRNIRIVGGNSIDTLLAYTDGN